MCDVKQESANHALSVVSSLFQCSLEVLFDVDGKQQWHEGQVTGMGQGGQWQVLFDDGEEHLISWPDRTGEVRIVQSKHRGRSSKQSQVADPDFLRYAAALLLFAAAKSEASR